MDTGLHPPSLRGAVKPGARGDEAISKRQSVVIAFTACYLPFGDCFGPASPQGPLGPRNDEEEDPGSS